MMMNVNTETIAEENQNYSSASVLPAAVRCMELDDEIFFISSEAPMSYVWT
jgi:hypothetical protein